MKNDNIGNQEFEQLLKNKMNELSESVDCFDKISAKAFPKEKPDFSESGFTVSDLENVTGKRSAPAILRWTAAAAAAVVCITFIPKTGFVQHVLYNVSNSSVKKIYSELLNEIIEETSDGSYNIIDMPLEQYIAEDVLVTPLLCCPFEDSGRDDANVRIFIRQFDCVDTNHVYAVEYTGDYSEENIIAAAESKFKISDDAIENAFELKGEDLFYRSELETVKQCFGTKISVVADGSMSAVADSMASFCQPFYYKDDYRTAVINASVIYGHLTSDDGYFYDICAFDSSGEKVSLVDRRDMWKRSIYFNGNSAMPKSDNSGFRRVELFGRTGSSGSADVTAVMPYKQAKMAELAERSNIGYVDISQQYNFKDRILYSYMAPFDPTAKKLMNIYLSDSLVSGDIVVNALIGGDSKAGFTYSAADLDWFVNDVSEDEWADDMTELLRQKRSLN